MESARRLYLNRAGDKVVPEGSLDAAVLLCGAGAEVDEGEIAQRYGPGVVAQMRRMAKPKAETEAPATAHIAGPPENKAKRPSPPNSVNSVSDGEGDGVNDGETKERGE